MTFRMFMAMAILLSVTVGGFTGNSWAQTPKGKASAEPVPLRIAILNMERIKREALAIKNIRTQIDKHRKEFRLDIQKEEKALQAANQELAKKRTILSPEAFSSERRQFEQKVVQVQKLVQKYKVDLNQALGKAMLKVDRRLNDIVKETARKKGISVVFRRRQTILVAVYLDMTDEILGILNAQLKKVAVAKPGKK